MERARNLAGREDDGKDGYEDVREVLAFKSRHLPGRSSTLVIRSTTAADPHTWLQRLLDEVN